MSNDRIQTGESGSKLPKPEVKIIMDGNQVFKPGMRTYLFGPGVGTGGGVADGVTGSFITYAACTCDTVPVCSCDTYVSSACSCNSHSSGYSVCSCVPVH